jgi:hypothetical protein
MAWLHRAATTAPEGCVPIGDKCLVTTCAAPAGRQRRPVSVLRCRCVRPGHGRVREGRQPRDERAMGPQASASAAECHHGRSLSVGGRTYGSTRSSNHTDAGEDERASVRRASSSPGRGLGRRHDRPAQRPPRGPPGRRHRRRAQEGPRQWVVARRQRHHWVDPIGPATGDEVVPCSWRNSPQGGSRLVASDRPAGSLEGSPWATGRPASSIP